MMANAPFTEIDFAQAKENLKNYLKGQNRFRDYDFDGSNMNVLLDLLAYNTLHNNLYRNMAFSEMFLDSAQLRENVMSHAKEMNYTPSSVQSAQSTLDITINFPNPASGPSTLSIPRGTRFSAVCGPTTYTFITDQNRSVQKIGNVYRLTDLKVYEGRIRREFYEVNESEPEPYVINNENVDISSVRVIVREDAAANSEREEYLYKTEIFGVEQDDPAFYVEPHFANLYKVVFGRNRFGREPTTGNVIEIQYRVSEGSKVNGARNWTAVDTVDGYTITVNSGTRSSNGSERESIEDIKFFAPRSIQIQERAVTANDYEILLKQRFPNIQAISVYGGDEADPPRYGSVVISVDVFGTDGSGSSEITEYRNYLKDKTPLTIEPIFIPPEFLYADLSIRVFYDANKTTKSSSELETIVRNAILEYSNASLNKFNATLRQSRLSAVIDSSDVSILSTDITSKALIDYSPPFNVTQNPSFDFNGPLIVPYPFSEASGFTTYKPSFETSRFVLEGTTVNLQDDGVGNIIAVTGGASTRRVFKPSVGTIDYSAGTARLSNLVVDNYFTSAISVIGNTLNKDIKTTRNKILAIRNKDVNIQMVAVQ